MNISILCNNKSSWIFKYLYSFANELKEESHCVNIYDNHKDMETGDIALFLGCTKIVPEKYLKLHQHNLVVHESDLPKGKGFSPLSWQVLEGKNDIPVVLFEAEANIDEGEIYEKTNIKLNGSELLDEIREKQWVATYNLIKRFLMKYPNIKGEKQIGESTYYSRRTKKDDELDITKSIIELFNHFRIADNESYPVYFYHFGHKYVLKINKVDEKGDF